MILKHFCKKDQIKFWSCCQEFKSFTKYIILFYYFHLNLILLSVAYKWFCCDSKQKQFSEKTETLALPSSSLLYLFSFSPSLSQVAKIHQKQSRLEETMKSKAIAAVVLRKPVLEASGPAVPSLQQEVISKDSTVVLDFGALFLLCSYILFPGPKD